MSPDDAVGLVAVVLIFGFVPILISLCAIVFFVFRRGGSKRTRQQEEEEMRLMQQMNAGLLKLGDRVDALETLLMDRMEHPRESSRREL